MKITGITEEDIAEYLANTPGFFERHAELLASIQLTSPHGNRAVSLQERQMEMLRTKIRGLELRLIEMIRNGQENLGIADKLYAWARQILLAARAEDVPEVLVQDLEERFLVPQAALRVWGPGAPAGLTCTEAVSEDVRSFASSLGAPYCGLNSGFEATRWLPESKAVMSMAMIPLRHEGASQAFGLLVLGSPDATRFAADMGTEFLQRIGELASAALSRLVPAPHASTA